MCEVYIFVSVFLFVCFFPSKEQYCSLVVLLTLCSRTEHHLMKNWRNHSMLTGMEAFCKDKGGKKWTRIRNFLSEFSFCAGRCE